MLLLSLGMIMVKGYGGEKEVKVTINSQKSEANRGVVCLNRNLSRLQTPPAAVPYPVPAPRTPFERSQ